MLFRESETVELKEVVVDLSLIHISFGEMKSMRKLRLEKTARLKRSSCREPIW